MTGTYRKLGTMTSVLGLAVAGVTLSAAPSQAAVGPKGCSAYVSHTNNHVAVAMCASGNGTWRVMAKCAGPGRVNGPYRGDEGYRTRGKEKASVLNCGSSGYPIELKVVDKKA
ncbi:hypothetical protein U9R90_12755 [Streptomyces sp. E11-3]|uniref:hypothetical protein n=1 Tax=Streptomyces sp. E11-3 TaxID=3110112 RepID=UPI00397F4E50